MESDNRPIPWTSDRARETYNLAGWSAGYFDINAEGYAVALSPLHPDHPGVDLFGLSQELKAAGLSLPVLVRFNYILRDRLDQLCNAFARAMKESDYRGRYTAVYPIKVNQQRGVVEQLLKHGGARVGLEAGSKPELMAVIGMSELGGVIVCNGYKDREYIRLGLFAKQL